MIVVVADASPLIALERVGHLELLKALFGEVLVPPAVAAEVAPRLVLPPWICERALRQPISREVLRATLGPGESEAISHLSTETDGSDNWTYEWNALNQLMTIS